MVYPISRYTLFPFLRSLVSSAKGLEHLPKKTPFIIAANHVSQTDPLLISATLFPVHPKKIHYISIYREVGKFFKETIAKKWAGCVLLDQQNRAKAVDDCVEVLKTGDIVGVFPEGVRNPKENVISRGYTGVIRIALNAKVPIVPIGIITKGEKHRKREDGRHISDWRDAVSEYLFKHEPFHIKIGKPINLSEHYNKPVTYELLRTLTNSVMQKLSSLSNRPFKADYIPSHYFQETSSSISFE